MRVTGGRIGGRRIHAPRSMVRPTQDRVREALFSSLAGRLPGARALDLFAGTGALGLESWSRGADAVTWVEKDRLAYEQLRKNVRALCGDERAVHCVRRDVFRFLSTAAQDRKYDLVLADPPYERGLESQVPEKLLRILGSESILRSTGLFILEQDRGRSVLESPEWKLIRNRTYGRTRLLTYVRDPLAAGGARS